jgi:hypothetical protein
MTNIAPNTETLKGLIGSDLSGFHIVEMVEVYATDEDGRRIGSAMIFQHESVAQVFMDNGKDVGHKGMGKILVLTNGEIYFTLESVRRVSMFSKDDMDALRKEVIEKIPQSIREFLRIK